MASFVQVFLLVVLVAFGAYAARGSYTISMPETFQFYAIHNRQCVDTYYPSPYRRVEVHGCDGMIFSSSFGGAHFGYYDYSTGQAYISGVYSVNPYTYACQNVEGSSASIPEYLFPYSVAWENYSSRDGISVWSTETSDELHNFVTQHTFTARTSSTSRGYIPILYVSKEYNATQYYFDNSSSPICVSTIEYINYNESVDCAAIMSAFDVCNRQNTRRRSLTPMDPNYLKEVIFNPLSLMPLASEFSEFMLTYRKAYLTHESFSHAIATFHDNFHRIHEHNSNPRNTYRLGINRFADMTRSEFKNTILSRVVRPDDYDPSANAFASRHQVSSTAIIPDSLDWRVTGNVAIVKDQGECGSCWAFGSIGAIESAYSIKYGSLRLFSEQQLVDCSWNVTAVNAYDSNLGCDGGFASNSYIYLSMSPRLTSEELYPYIAFNGFCRDVAYPPLISILGYSVVAPSEAAVMDALVNHGPLSVAMDASDLSSYSSGIYSPPYCGTTLLSLDHEVLLVGYGVDYIDGAPQEYWLIKNSWSAQWGENGYFKLARGSSCPSSGMCGILLDATYPILGNAPNQ